MIELDGASVVVPGAAHDAGGNTTILEPTTLHLGEQRISIIGANGSGKSTLARLLNGLVLPSSGAVRVLAHTGFGDQPGRPATEPASASAPPVTWLDTARHGSAVRRAVGFVFTDPNAQLVMPTVLEDVALSLRHTHKRKQARQDAALEVLERFALAPLAERSVHTLSGGQKQMLAIAAVLATDPAILVADEPTTLLDLRNSRRIGDLLMSVPQQVIVVTHDLDLAARADRTLVVDRARIVFDGDPADAIEHYRGLAARTGAAEGTEASKGTEAAEASREPEADA